MKRTKLKLLCFLCLSFLISTNCFSQTEEQKNPQSKENIKFDFDYIFSLDAAKKYSAKHPTWLAHIYTIPESDTSKRYEDVLRAPYMMTFHWYDIKRDINFLGRVVDTFTTDVWGVKYIAFDAKDFEKSEITSFIDTIIHRYNRGIPFDTLSNQFNKYNHNGEFHHVKEGDLVEELDGVTREAEVGDIISTYVPLYDYYYVVIKSKVLRPERFRKVLVTQYR